MDGWAERMISTGSPARGEENGALPRSNSSQGVPARARGRDPAGYADRRPRRCTRACAGESLSSRSL